MVKWIIMAVVAVVLALCERVPSWLRPTSSDADPNTKKRERLIRKLRKSKWFIVPIACSTMGCGAKTIYVADGTPVRLRQEIHNAKVWVLDEDGRPTPGAMDLPEGWYCLPLAPEDE